MVLRFENKVVIVTGASSGIGQGVILGFAKEGAKVVLHGRNPERIRETLYLLKKSGTLEEKILVVDGQIQDDLVQRKIIDETVKKFGKIDVLVNNAGIPTGGHQNEPRSTENLDEVWSVNVRAPYRLAELAIPYLKLTKGNIINVSAVMSEKKIFETPFAAIYSMTTAALDKWTRSDSQRLAKLGIRINSVLPGPIETNITNNGLPEDVDKKQIRETVVPSFVSVTPLAKEKRGSVDQVVPVFLFLADEASSSYITGVNWLVDGGSSSYAKPFPWIKND